MAPVVDVTTRTRVQGFVPAPLASCRAIEICKIACEKRLATKKCKFLAARIAYSAPAYKKKFSASDIRTLIQFPITMSKKRT
jgi:hypothetical protein